jgi:DNA-directed RNA polymerase subunit RPC12/RpoP
MISFLCPACKAANTHARPGEKIHCAVCGQKLLVPTPPPPPQNKTVLGELSPYLALPAPASTPPPQSKPPSDSATKPPSLPQQLPSAMPSAEPPIRQTRRSQKSRRSDQIRCPYCESTLPPLKKKRIAPAGWIAFGAVLAMGFGMCFVGICFWPLLIAAFVCFPLSILGLLMTEEDRICAECDEKLN